MTSMCRRITTQTAPIRAILSVQPGDCDRRESRQVLSNEIRPRAKQSVNQTPGRWVVGGRKCSMAMFGFWNLFGLHISFCRASVRAWRAGDPRGRRIIPLSWPGACFG